MNTILGKIGEVPATEASSDATATHDPVDPPGRRGYRPGVVEVFILGFLALALVQERVAAAFDGRDALQTWATIFVSIVIQATPFLVLGVLLSAAITAFVPPTFFARVLPRRTAAAVPVAGAAGMILPGCECASVPVASSMIGRGVAAPVALTFLLAAPAVNPVVLVATAVAFPGMPEMVGARLAASMAVAVLVGWLWMRLGRGEWLRLPRTRTADPSTGRVRAFRDAALHDFCHAGGFLVVGGLTAATLNVVVPESWLESVAGSLLLSVVVLAFLAVILAICSEADAFVAASLTGFSPVAQLTFMVVGPVVDVKLISLQAGTFGPGFAARFAPLVLVVAVLASLAVGGILL